MALQIETDLPPGLACLKNVDALLRCPICFDFLDITMMTKCSHNFCSLCIRKFLSCKLQCPVCNTQLTEIDLRNNRILDDLIFNYKVARQQLSKAAFESPPISPVTQTSAVKRKRGIGNSSDLSHYFHKKQKTCPSEETSQDSSITQCDQRGGMKTMDHHNINEADVHEENNELPVVVKEEPIDGEEASIHVLMSVKQQDTSSCSFSNEADIAHTSSPTQDVKPVIKVECPVCSVSVSKQFINKHLDMCLCSTEKKKSLRRSPTLAMRPAAKLVYNLLSSQELKRRLKECHLSVKGSKDQMIKRHQEFVHMYNAQCDSLNPKSAEDIAKELEENEKTRNRLQKTSKPQVMVFSKDQTEKDIDELHSNYRNQHSSDFSRLIAQVQGRLNISRQTRIKQKVSAESESAQTTDSADSKILIVEDEESDEEPWTSNNDWLPSRTYSDVSISSSISDIFGP